MYDPQELAIRQSVGHVLRTHPEGQSLFGEASHYHVLAEESAASVTRAFTGMQEARFGYEELRRRLDPRRARTIHLGVSMTLLTAIFTVLVPLDAIELSGVLARWMTPVAAAAAAAWIGCSWVAALAKREGQGGLLAAVTTGALAVGLLLAALHGEGASPQRGDVWHRFGIGVLMVLLIFALAAIAAVLIARTEPASLVSARRRWHRARDEYVAAVRTHRRDAEAAVVAEQGWHSLIEVQSNVSTDGTEQPGMTQQP